MFHHIGKGQQYQEALHLYICIYCMHGAEFTAHFKCSLATGYCYFRRPYCNPGIILVFPANSSGVYELLKVGDT